MTNSDIWPYILAIAIISYFGVQTRGPIIPLAIAATALLFIFELYLQNQKGHGITLEISCMINSDTPHCSDTYAGETQTNQAPEENRPSANSSPAPIASKPTAPVVHSRPIPRPSQPIRTQSPSRPRVSPRLPSPSPQTSRTPRAEEPARREQVMRAIAVPTNRSKWGDRLQHDYPARARRKELEGRTSLLLVVGEDGRVRDCRITKSSGHKILDRSACRTLSRIARFKRPTNRPGSPPIAEYSTNVVYKLN